MIIIIKSGKIFFNLLLRKEFVTLAMHCIDSELYMLITL